MISFAIMKTNIKICLFVLLGLLTVSCSTSKKATTRKGDASITASAPDYNRIKKEINTKDSEFYYPDLLRRFEAADPTLTAEHMYYFYFGTATRPDYNPYNADNYEELHEALRGDTLTDENWRKAEAVVEQQLKSEPTNLRFHLYKEIICSNLYGNESKERINAHKQVVMLYAAIRDTGNGQSMESAFHVINVTDEYGMMDLLGLSLKMQSLVEDKGQAFDVMELEDNEYGWKSLYFNVTVCLKAANKMFGS